MKALLLCCLLPLSLWAQHPLTTASGIDWTKSSGTSTWYPTNATTAKLVYWFELQPILGAYENNVGAPIPCVDNDQVKMWTNFAAGFNGIGPSALTSDQTKHGTNFVSGGGGNGTSRRISWSGTGSGRMDAGAWAGTPGTNGATWLFVFSDNSSSGTQWILSTTATAPNIIWNAKGIDYNQGSATVSSAKTLVVGQYYIGTMFFAAGASSHFDTNGVQMSSGTGGTGVMGGITIDQDNGSAPFNGNVCRVWIYQGQLSGADYTRAIAQCKIDFGIQ